MSSDKADLIKLSDVLISDLGSPSISLDLVLAKAYRLAELSSNIEAMTWLNYELHGYDSSTPIGEKYSRLTHRWDGSSPKGYFQSANALAHKIEAMSQSLQAHQDFKPSGDWATMQQNEKAKQVSSWAQAIEPIRTVISGIRAEVLIFASRVRAEAQFSETSRSIFEQYQHEVDEKLLATAGQAFERFPSVFERLNKGDPEAISHALTSCRRIIDGFADALFPGTAEPITVDDQKLDCGRDKPRNRLRAYMAQVINSRSRRDRLNKNLGELYSKVSAGVHSDVGVDEARALVLNTYLCLAK